MNLRLLYLQVTSSFYWQQSSLPHLTLLAKSGPLTYHFLPPILDPRCHRSKPNPIHMIRSYELSLRLSWVIPALTFHLAWPTWNFTSIFTEIPIQEWLFIAILQYTACQSISMTRKKSLCMALYVWWHRLLGSWEQVSNWKRYGHIGTVKDGSLQPILALSFIWRCQTYFCALVRILRNIAL